MRNPGGSPSSAEAIRWRCAAGTPSSRNPSRVSKCDMLQEGSAVWSTLTTVTSGTPMRWKSCGRPGGWFETTYSHCCFAGDRVKWTRLLHDSPYLHEALHRPHCPGHYHLRDYQVWEDRDGQFQFDTAAEAEYPWVFAWRTRMGCEAI